MLRVMKFGGTSVGSAAAIAQAVDILAAAEGPVVGVVSALNGVTNQLLAAAQAAASGDAARGAELREVLLGRHLPTLAELVQDPARRLAAAEAIATHVERCGRLIDSVAVLHDLSPRVQNSSRAHAAHVRLPGARLPVGHDESLLIQDRT